MPAVPDDVRDYIAGRLARFDAPSAVAAAVRDLFGVEITRQGVEAHDPTKRAGRSMPASRVAAFEAERVAFLAERSAFLADTTGILIASRVGRLRGLQRMCETAEARGDFAMAARVLAQAAREMGQGPANGYPGQRSAEMSR